MVAKSIAKIYTNIHKPTDYLKPSGNVSPVGLFTYVIYIQHPGTNALTVLMFPYNLFTWVVLSV